MKLQALHLLSLLFCFCTINSYGQITTKADAPNIFIDCHARCYQDFIKQELTYVNYMLNRQMADVFVQITNQRTGAGGRKYQVELTGRERFNGMVDTLRFITDANESDNSVRTKLLQNIEKGLLPYLLKTSLSDDISFEIKTQPTTDKIEEEVDDPWKQWVYGVGVWSNFNGGEIYKNNFAYGWLNASKVTEDFKWESSVSGNYRSNITAIPDEDTVRFVQTESRFRTTFVKSINEHLSAGFFLRVAEESFANYRLDLSFQPAIEYNFYPYKEANKKQFTSLYRIGPQYASYVDTTIFDVQQELLWRHSIEFRFKKIEDWGNVDIEFTYGNYLHDFELLFAFLNPEIELNIWKGLSLDIGGGFELIRNQLNLRKSDASRDDILLQIQELKSNYNYFFNLGINYRFGSKYANVVNVRF